MTIMECHNFITEMKDIQSKLLEFIENDEDNFENLKIIFNDQKIHDDKHKLKIILHLVAGIENNHHRGNSFFDKIEKILTFLQGSIKIFFSNSELFQIFKNNKRIILFFIKKEIIIIDKNITLKITNGKYVEMNYPQYFAPEIKVFINEKWFPKYDKDKENTMENSWIEEINKEIPENFYEKRKNGENDNYICELIRDDLVKEFIIYITKNNYSLDSKIVPSIYETNQFLIQNKINESSNHQLYNPTLIEYATFYGSIQIFQYLRLNNVELKESLWYYAIHGNNPEIIHLLEENHVQINEKNVFIESIKCHHNDIAYYFQNTVLSNNEENSYYSYKNILKYYNFSFISCDLIDQKFFLDLCKYDYYQLVNFLINNRKDIYINLNIQYYLF